jgi:tripartite-type tricarboxylate transporter receptor subunit TctC
VRAGKLKAIAATAPVRSSLVPEMPTLREVGVSGTDLEVWTALVGPASLPPAAVARLSGVVVELLREPEARGKLLNAGWQAAGTAPEGLANRMRADTTQLAEIIRTRGIKSE